MSQEIGSVSGLKNLLRINLELNSYHELEPLLDRILKEAVNVTAAEAASLWLLDDNNSLEITPKSILSPIKVDSSKLRVRIGEGIVGRVILSGKAELIADVRQDPGWAERVDHQTGFVTRSILCIPLQTDHVFGALQLLNKQNGALFDENDAEMATAFANLASVAYERNRLYHHQQQWLTNMLNVLVNIIELRYPESSGHSNRVAACAEAIGKELGLTPDELNFLKWGSYLHDIGKLAVDANDPGSYENHPQAGARIISKIDPDNDLEKLFLIVACHHQYIDGSGFPKEDEDQPCFVPLLAQIVGLANCYDHLTNQEKLHFKNAAERLSAEKKFDPVLLEKLRKLAVEWDADTMSSLRRLKSLL